MKYELQLCNPKEFYNELDRPVHFLNLSSLEDGDGVGADREDLFAKGAVFVFIIWFVYYNVQNC